MRDIKRVIAMTTRERIWVELDRMSDEQLEQIYTVAQQLTHAQRPVKKERLLQRLQRIQIEGPEDLSVNFEKYMGKNSDG
jgi:hypothetical protein